MHEVFQEAIIEESGLPYDVDDYIVKQNPDKQHFVLVEKETGKATILEDICPNCNQKMFFDNQTEEMYCARCDT